MVGPPNFNLTNDLGDQEIMSYRCPKCGKVWDDWAKRVLEAIADDNDSLLKDINLLLKDLNLFLKDLQ